MQSTLNAAEPLVAELAELLLVKNWTMTTAESCTGGLVAAALTELPGSSGWFHQGVVSYSNEAKTTLLNVGEGLLVQHGAVSQLVVEAMASGAITKADANVAVSISGIAGPGGGTPDKPVGTVWIGWGVRQSTSEIANLNASKTDSANISVSTIVKSEHYCFAGDRQAIRSQALMEALRGTIQLVTSV